VLCLLALAILWWFGRKLNWLEVRQAVSTANPYLLGLAVLLISLAYFFRAVRWGALLAPLCPASLRNLFIATTVGFGAVFLFGRTGEIVRPVVLPMRDPAIRPSAAFVTVMVERIYDMIAVVLLFAINLLWFRPPANAGVEFGRVRLAGIILLLVNAVSEKVRGRDWLDKENARWPALHTSPAHARRSQYSRTTRQRASSVGRCA
jgi:glycosyltransferase 2 family protein